MLNEILEVAMSVLDQSTDCGTAITALPQGWIRVQPGENPSEEVTCTLARGSTRTQLHLAHRNSVWYLGRRLRFGYPLPGDGAAESEISWFIPNEELQDISRVEDFAFGEMSFDTFHSLVNHTAKMEMANPLSRFPKSCLLMQYGAPMPLRRGIPQPPERFFVLWSQREDVVQLHDLPRTQSPFEAAEHSRELGFSPTIYRCTSGHMIPFLRTEGWAYIQGAG